MSTSHADQTIKSGRRVFGRSLSREDARSPRLAALVFVWTAIQSGYRRRRRFKHAKVLAGAVRLGGHAAGMAAREERVVYIRPRTILVVLGILLATLGLLAFVYLAWHVITWILIAVFLALALNPAVEWF